MNDAFDHLPILIAGIFMLAVAAGILPKTKRGHGLVVAFGVILLASYVAHRTGLMEIHLPIGHTIGLVLDLLAATAFVAALILAGRSRSPAG